MKLVRAYHFLNLLMVAQFQFGTASVLPASPGEGQTDGRRLDGGTDWVLTSDNNQSCDQACEAVGKSCNQAGIGSMESIDSDNKMEYVARLLGLTCTFFYAKNEGQGIPYVYEPSPSNGSTYCYYNLQAGVPPGSCSTSSQNPGTKRVCCCGSNCKSEETTSDKPSLKPSQLPSDKPSLKPSRLPSDKPSLEPSRLPSDKPSLKPSQLSSDEPSLKPSQLPSDVPSLKPSQLPSDKPSLKPSQLPSDVPSLKPSQLSSDKPSLKPSQLPSDVPSLKPSRLPSDKPSLKPSRLPSDKPSLEPSQFPSDEPSLKPSQFEPDPESIARSVCAAYLDEIFDLFLLSSAKEEALKTIVCGVEKEREPV